MKNLITSFLHEFPQPITGSLALLFALAFEQAKASTPGQWGNAYFRCSECEGATDCTGEESWDDYSQAFCVHCDADLFTAELRLSEGWVEREADNTTLPLTHTTNLLAKLLDGIEGMIQEQGEDSPQRYWDIKAIHSAQKLLPSPFATIEAYQHAQLKQFAERLKKFLRENRIFTILDKQSPDDPVYTDWSSGGCYLLAQCLHEFVPTLFDVPVQLEMLINEVGVPEHIVLVIFSYGTPFYLDADGLFTRAGIIYHWQTVERRLCTTHPLDPELIKKHEITTSSIKHAKLLAALKDEFCVA